MASYQFNMFKAAEKTMAISAFSIALEGFLFIYNKLPPNIFMGLFATSCVIFLISAAYYNGIGPNINHFCKDSTRRHFQLTADSGLSLF